MPHNDPPYTVPLDPESPWPKFKRDAAQTARSPVMPTASGRLPWQFETELGVFSSAVIDGDGNIYIGSGDHLFYCFSPEGEVRWSFRTGEIVDSAALLDNKGRVYVASCDGFVYALDRTTGEEIWRFRSDTISECHEKGVDSFVDWFEGHIGIDAEGTLLIPNDNFHTYALDRDTGRRRRHFLTDDQTWSCPAYDPRSNRWFMGTNYFVLKNVFCFDGADGRRLWKRGTLGSMVASPLLVDIDGRELVIVAGFDGLVRGLKRRTGKQVWKFGARDHFYASPVLSAEGEVIIPAADGTIYALDAASGTLRWSFDTPEPIRSTPAVDGAGNIYFGNGEGKLYCISGEGEFRWSYRCTDSTRSDVNSSPALGPHGVVVGCDDGTIVSVPYDYPLTDPGDSDPRCETAYGSPTDGAHLYTLSRFGKRESSAPETIDANEPLTLSLVVRDNNTTQTTLIESRSLSVTTDPAVGVRSSVSADRRFITVIPEAPWAGPDGGTVEVSVSGSYRTGPRRFGLKRFGGRRTGSFERRFTFGVRPHHDEGFPFTIPRKPLEPAGIIEIGRLAPALPTILPSYNQLGFDSIHYHLTCLERTEAGALLWGVGAKLVGGGEDRSIVDPELAVRFAVNLEYEGGLVTLISEEGFTLEFNGWDIPYDLFRVSSARKEVVEAARAGQDAAGPSSPAPLLFKPGHVNAEVRCDDIRFYGPFLKVLGVSDFRTGMMRVAGAVGKVRYLGERMFDRPQDVGTVRAFSDRGRVYVALDESRLIPSEHNVGLLLVDLATGRSVPIDYTKVTRVESNRYGALTSLSVPIPRRYAKRRASASTPDESESTERLSPAGERFRVYLLIDGLPVFRDTIA